MHEHEPQEHTMSERVLSALEVGAVAPKPRWHFLLRESVVWVVAFVAFALGSVATALTLYITQASWYVERHVAMSDLATLFHMVPYVWLLLIAVGIFYTIHAVHATRRGYRWHTSWLVGVALGASIAAGFGIHASGASEALDRYLIAAMPMYHPLSGFDPSLWSNQSTGVVAGVIERIDADTFTVREIQGDLIQVATTTDTTLPPLMELRVGMPVRVRGTTTSESGSEIFEASDVRPFRGRGGGRHDPSRGLRGGGVGYPGPGPQSPLRGQEE